MVMAAGGSARYATPERYKALISSAPKIECDVFKEDVFSVGVSI
jgi:hypothetical protein